MQSWWHHTTFIFDCSFAKFIWRIVRITFNIDILKSISHVYRLWLSKYRANIKYQIFVWVGTICWAIWISRNDIVFNKVRFFTPMQVIYKGTHWIRTWSVFQKEEKRNILKQAGASLERVTMEIFAHNGWKFSHRIEF